MHQQLRRLFYPTIAIETPSSHDHDVLVGGGISLRFMGRSGQVICGVSYNQSGCVASRGIVVHQLNRICLSLCLACFKGINNCNLRYSVMRQRMGISEGLCVALSTGTGKRREEPGLTLLQVGRESPTSLLGIMRRSGQQIMWRRVFCRKTFSGAQKGAETSEAKRLGKSFNCHHVLEHKAQNC